MTVSDEQIATFWAWFGTIERRLQESFTQDDLLEAIGAKVNELGPVQWELGPGEERANAFVISPDGVEDVVPLARRIIAMAPELPDWEFHPWKLRKPWPECFQLRNSDGEVTTIEPNAWEYILARYSDGMYDLTILAESLDKVDESLHWLAGKIVVEAVLGEGRWMTMIAVLGVKVRLDPDEAAHPRSELRYLAEHFDSLRPGVLVP